MKMLEKKQIQNRRKETQEIEISYVQKTFFVDDCFIFVDTV